MEESNNHVTNGQEVPAWLYVRKEVSEPGWLCSIKVQQHFLLAPPLLGMLTANSPTPAQRKQSSGASEGDADTAHTINTMFP